MKWYVLMCLGAEHLVGTWWFQHCDIRHGWGHLWVDSQNLQAKERECHQRLHIHMCDWFEELKMFLWSWFWPQVEGAGWDASPQSSVLFDLLLTFFVAICQLWRHKLVDPSWAPASVHRNLVVWIGHRSLRAMLPLHKLQCVLEVLFYLLEQRLVQSGPTLTP